MELFARRRGGVLPTAARWPGMWSLVAAILCVPCPQALAVHGADSLVISELGWDTNTETTPSSSSEYVEIYNPTSSTIVLNAGAEPGVVTNKGSYFLSDSPSEYYKIPGTGSGYKVNLGTNRNQTVLQFPLNVSIPPGGVVVVCNSGQNFLTEFFAGDLNKFKALPGSPQLFEVQETLSTIDNMTLQSSYSGGTGNPALNFANAGDGIILYYWDGASDLVKDVDMVFYKTSTVPNKTGLSYDGPDTGADTSSYFLEVPSTSLGGDTTAANVNGFVRRNVAEPSEADTQGNGLTGQAEVSEQWGGTNPTWLYAAHGPGKAPIPKLDGSLGDALTLLKPVATSAADGPGTSPDVNDYGEDGTLTELYVSNVDTNFDGVGDSFYLAVRGSLFGADNTSTLNASLILMDLDPGKNSGMSSLVDLGNQAGDVNGNLDTRITKAGVTLVNSGYTNLGFDAALGMDVPPGATTPAYGDDTVGWRTFGTGGTVGTSGTFINAGTNADIRFESSLQTLYPAAAGTAYAAPDGFETMMSWASLVSTVPSYVFLVAITTADDAGSVNPNTLPESSNNDYVRPQKLDKGLCFDVLAGKSIVYYVDSDRDGVGSSTIATYCGAPASGYATTSNDCNDADAAVFPGKSEVCDGLDNNCNGQTDEGVKTTFYADQDGDGYGSVSASTQACSKPTGYATTNTDCNDSDANINPGKSEVCDTLDNNCNGQIDDGLTAITSYVDADKDGYGTGTAVVDCKLPSGNSTQNGDCNDSNPNIKPGATEICDNIDNNCDGQIDEGARSTFYADTDNDGQGNPNSATQACTIPSGYVTSNTDCDDTNATRYQGAPELCDGLDNDCNGQVPANEADADSDGVRVCSPTSAPGDCNDADASINPNATEVCDSKDNNCNSQTDEGVTQTYYADADTDGFGTASNSKPACSAPSGYVTSSTDCNDTNPAINPSATEICNSIDDDCDAQVDDNDSSVTGQSTYYIDLDQDTFGGTTTLTRCTTPSGYVSVSGDCNDANASVNPIAAETCDGLDNDCDTQVDESLPPVVSYLDADNDGVGDASKTNTACNIPAGYVATSGDCDDNNPNRYPGAVEVCDGIDNNCNAQVDEAGQTTFYVDRDNDGFGDSSLSTNTCNAPAGYVSVAGDCNDTNPNVNPSLPEVCDGLDNDCNPATDENADQDQDQYSICDEDCDDEDANLNPGQAEICDGLDNDCNADTDEYVDADGDGVTICALDCDDTNGDISPNATETCNGIDDNCVGGADEGFTSDADSDGDPNLGCGGNDCDDTNASVSSTATEICTDDLDNNCDGAVDEADDACAVTPTPTPGTSTPGTDTPGTDTPTTDTPTTDTPGTDTPGTDTPGTDTPATDTPILDTPTPTPVPLDPDAGGCNCAIPGSTSGSTPAAPLGALIVGALSLASMLRRKSRR